jgi:exoribonuclease-2
MLLFSDQGPALCYAAHRLLTEDKIYFKKKGDRFEPRPASQVEDLLLQISAKPNDSKSGNLSLRKPSKDWLEQPLTWDKADRPRLEVLERLALFGDESSQRSQANRNFACLRTVSPTAEGAFDTLVAIGTMVYPHENLALRRSQIPSNRFPRDSLTMASAAASIRPHRTRINSG